MADNSYDWKYVSMGGTVRVRIESGEDIAHLGQLDQKKWTVLSCPVNGLCMDGKTLSYLDADGDGKIRVAEVISAAEWVTSVLKEKDSLLLGDDVLGLDSIDDSNVEGRKILGSANQILKNLGKEGQGSISLAETSDSVAIFSGTGLNGDGIITSLSSDDSEVKAAVEACISTVGSVVDRSGEKGVDAGLVQKFFAEMKDFSDWKAAADADWEKIFPYGDDTASASAAVKAIKDKVDDFYMRCKLVGFDEDASAALDVPVAKLAEIGSGNLCNCMEEIASYPLARPSKDAVLRMESINPAWLGAMSSLRSLVLGKALEGRDVMAEAEWLSIQSGLAPFESWMSSKKGSVVEGLGIEYVKSLLSGNMQETLLGLIDADKALEEEVKGIESVDRLLHYYRDFYRFLKNFVSFQDFYSRNGEPKAVFEAGKLFVDERCCNLCIKVEDMGRHADMASLSNMFLLYCTCSSPVLGKTMDILAVMTDGSTLDLRPGKNAIFYDRDGNDWDAVITKVVDNPVSIKQAFWSPYRKLAAFISDKLDKSAAEKDARAISLLQSKADGTASSQTFDIGKFAGIFAALGMAVGAIGVALTKLFEGIFALKAWQLVLVIAGIMLVISGPACFLAWRKLLKRNLGPVLDANGWAVNSKSLVNILFGATLTTVAKYPVIKGADPYVMKTPLWKRALLWLAALAVLFGLLYFSNALKCVGLPFEKEVPEAVVAEPSTVEPANS